VKSRTPAGSHRKVAALAAVAVATLLALALAVVVSGCAEEQSGGAVTTASGTSVGPSAGSSSTSGADSTTTTLPELLSEWDRELAETAQAQNRLAVYLTEQGTAQDDPRLAVIFGLRARAQAITGRQALDQGDLDLADMAMKDVYPTLNLGRNLAEGSVSQILEDAYAAVETLGKPSERPGEAAGSLDRFIASLRPLLDEAKALVPEN
jgi:hypothetical protein